METKATKGAYSINGAYGNPRASARPTSQPTLEYRNDQQWKQAKY